jgi:tetratricopeptide (TPR) repeat protein
MPVMAKYFLSLIMPGAGQILINGSYRGLVLCIVFFSAAAISVVRLMVAGEELLYDPLFLIAAAVAIGAWALAQWGMLMRLRLGSLQKCTAPARDRYFERGVKLYFQSRWSEAEREFRQALKLDFEDADALFYLAATLQEQGKTRRARRAWKRCLAGDDTEKWKWNVEQMRQRIG